MKINLSPRPSNPEESGGLAIRYAPAKRTLAKWRWRLVVLLLLWPLIFYLGKYLYGEVWATMPGYVETDQTILKTPVSGRIVNTLSIGAHVKAGDLVAVLGNDMLSAERDELIRNDKLAGNNKGNLVRHRQDAVALAERLHTYKADRYHVLLGLLAEGAATQADVASSLAQLQQADLDLLRARADLAVLGGSVSTRLSTLESMLQSLKIKTVASGTVTQLFGKPGEWIAEGSEVASIRSDVPPMIRAYVEPSWAKYATSGSTATLHFMDGGSIHAVVASVRMNTQREPSDQANPLTSRSESIVVFLKPVPSLPEQYRINGLPVSVRFDLL